MCKLKWAGAHVFLQLSHPLIPPCRFTFTSARSGRPTTASSSCRRRHRYARSMVYIGQGGHFDVAAGAPQGAARPPTPVAADGGQDAERHWAELARDKLGKSGWSLDERATGEKSLHAVRFIRDKVKTSHFVHIDRLTDKCIQGRAKKKIPLSFVTHVPSRLMGFALAA